MKKLSFILLLFLTLTAHADILAIQPHELGENSYTVLDDGFLKHDIDGRIYTLDHVPFTGIRTIAQKKENNQIILTQQKYKNGIPDGPAYQEIKIERPHRHYRPGARKPIIYLYPVTETKISVKVGHPEKFTHTYPKYDDGWHVLADPNSNLTDLKTGRHLYALYWEGLALQHDTPKDGFIVKGADTIAFLEEKLAMLGLTEREANEFIIYWLPKLENNPYNLIRFQSLAQQNENMPLDVAPTPDTVIRVMMEYQALDKEINLPEQVLPPTPTRTGFTVVEWGGTELKRK